MKIQVNKTSNPKVKPDQSQLGFGQNFTDHMFIMDYNENEGWVNPRIEPYGPFEISPAAAVFHYAQETFEGLKAYKSSDDEILFFRPEENIKRLNRSNERLCIPELNEEDVWQAIKELVELEKEWIPTNPGTSLYLRPFVIATDPYLGVRPSKNYRFMIILSPVGAYYAEGFNPTKIYVEDKFIRAAEGGTGFAKAGGNYAASLKPQLEAQAKGYSQVLYLDSVEKKFVEEIGTSNAFFKIDGEIITSPLTGTILPGVTRDSVIKLLNHWGFTVKEKKITIDEIYKAYHDGLLEEVFASGTAAVVSPVGVLSWNGDDITVNNNKVGDLTQRLYDSISAIQLGKEDDPFNWVKVVR